MKPLFDVEGRYLLRELGTCRHPLFVFDFDGTLSPIVAEPDAARIPPPVLRRLRILARQFPLAVVSGRALDDLQPRLPPEVIYAVGNRGIEGVEPPRREWVARLDPVRRRIARRLPSLSKSGVRVEDKHYSIALHYRQAADADDALRAIRRLQLPAVPGLMVDQGHCVINLLPEGTPDKGAMLQQMAELSGAEGGLYVGDDSSDEAAFRVAPPGWLTVRVGTDSGDSQARFYIDSQAHMPVLLQELVNAIRWRRGGPETLDPPV